jgi:ComF family protein
MFPLNCKGSKRVEGKIWELPRRIHGKTNELHVDVPWGRSNTQYEAIVLERDVTTGKSNKSRGGKMLLSRIVKNCMDIVFPPGCTVCGVRLAADEQESFCPGCRPGIRPLVRPLCRICGIEVGGAAAESPLCGECLRSPPPYSIARSVVRYEWEVQQLVHKLKYNSDLSVLPGISQLIGRYDMVEFADVDCIVVVPLHLLRLRRRGLNQAAVLAGLFFADRRHLIKADWLVRIRNTVPQTELGRTARRKNLRGAFQTRAASNFQGATVCLIDDVLTTGTTVRECSRVILQEGAVKVKVLTLARVNAPHRGIS